MRYRWEGRAEGVECLKGRRNDKQTSVPQRKGHTTHFEEFLLILSLPPILLPTHPNVQLRASVFPCLPCPDIPRDFVAKTLVTAVKMFANKHSDTLSHSKNKQTNKQTHCNHWAGNCLLANQQSTQPRFGLKNGFQAWMNLRRRQLMTT